MTARGRPPRPDRLGERLTIVMSMDLRKALKRRADELDVTMADLARKVLSESLLQGERVNG